MKPGDAIPGEPADHLPLGPAVPRKTSGEEKKEPHALDARGTILVDADGKLSTALPTPPV